MNIFNYLISFSLLIALCFQFSECVATFSIDLSGEFIKVAIVKSGVPMETALNKDSDRKTAAVIYIKDGERSFDNEALDMGVKYPKYCYRGFTRLLAKNLDDSEVIDFLKQYPYYTLKQVSKGQLAFVHDENTHYTVEELFAMLLQHSKEIADNFAKVETKAGILVIPPYYNQEERAAILRVVKIADINVLQLMNSNAAVALNFGVFRHKTFNTTMQYYMFYDVGSTASIATVVGYQIVKNKEYGIVVENPQATIYGVGYDRSLGATQFTLRLQNHLAKVFNSANKGKQVTSKPRAMAKLYKEAIRVMKVLSANTETYAQIENVMDDIDLKVKVTRDEFEQLNHELFDRFKAPLNKALEAAQIPLTSIKEVILMGGGTRIPKFQETIKLSADKKELGKGINTDEAASLGAVYQAAFDSPGFRVKNFILRDGNLQMISVDFDRYKLVDGKQQVQFTSRVLFNVMNPFPQKKVMTFNKHTVNFHFNISVGSDDALKYRLMRVDVTNLTEAYANLMSENTKYSTDFKGVKAHFSLDKSGVFNFNYVEALFDRQWLEAKEESTLEKLGNTISNLFGSSPESSTANATDSNNSTSTNNNSTSTNDSSSNSTNNSNNTSTTGDSQANTTTTTDKPKPLKETIRELLQFTMTYLQPEYFSDETVQLAIDKLEPMKKADEDRRAHVEAQNKLESYIFYILNLFENPMYQQVTIQDERTKITEAAHKQSLWFEEEAGPAIETKVFNEKYNQLHTLLIDVEYRVQELKQRQPLLETFVKTLNTSHLFLDNLKNFTSDDATKSIFTTTEYQTMKKLVDEAEKWYAKTNETLKTMKLYENPTITTSDIQLQIQLLEREMGYLFNKLNIWRNTNAYQQTNNATNDSANSTNKDEKTNKSSESSDKSTPKSDSKQTETDSTSQKDDPKSKSEESTTDKSKDIHLDL